MYSVPMAIVDFIPVFLFLAGALMLLKDLSAMPSKVSYALFCAGSIDVFLAGFLKALYKLLYAANVCDFQALSNIFFPLQALGFLMAGAGILSAFLLPRKSRLYAAAPVFFSGTMLFVVLMVLGLGCEMGSLFAAATKMKKKGSRWFFIASFVFSLMMGYLSSRDFTQSYMNWAAELINTLGMLCFFLGARALHRAGLNKYQWNRSDS